MENKKEVKNISVRVTYEVGIGGLEVGDKILTQLRKMYEEESALDALGHSNASQEEVRQWLIDNIEERDACFLTYEIDELEE